MNSSSTMTLQLLQLHSHSANKLQILFKVLLLEAARSSLEKELRVITNKVYEDVKVFLMSSFSTSVYNDICKALNEKCQLIDRVSVLLKDLTFESRICLQPLRKNGVTTSLCQPSGVRGILCDNALWFGPMLQNSIMATSIIETVQMLRARQGFQWLTRFPTPQLRAVKVDTMPVEKCSIDTVYTSLSQDAKGQEIKTQLEEKCQAEATIIPSALIKSPKVNTEPTAKFIWGLQDVHMQCKKQTTTQLLHFLKAQAKSVESLEAFVITQPSVATQSEGSSIRHVSHEQNDAKAPKTLLTDTVNHKPVFRLKRVNSNGLLTYACVIATNTELWDFQDVETIVTAGEAQRKSMNWCSDNKACPSEIFEGDKACTIKNLTLPYEHCDYYSPKKPQTESANIPEFQVRKFEEPEVVVSHVVSPSNFYIQHVDSITKLQALFNGWESSSSYAEQNCIPDIGAHVIARFPKEEQWCRAQVTKICGVNKDEATDGAEDEASIKVEVRRLDHGDTACVSLCNLKELSAGMCKLPLQSMQVSMANVIPKNGTDWTEEAVDWFREMVHNRTFYARIYTDGPGVSVELFLEKGKLGAMRRGPPLSLRLAQNGHAKHSSKLKNMSLPKDNRAQVQWRKQDSDWEKYLISYYTQQKN
ncbi:uncharacterized protein LOC109515836 isoform X2 [Hippocampus comes]|uniref:uncharacterized protein LOC109515836 isoform X2 n=1 Tax=Hippocampus comes TaxID=109280 RepID=UPI00094EE5AE|nr:PREDICTED: uncharacterized protein LOC109515836 isoform X2 [Hippocampus comes]